MDDRIGTVNDDGGHMWPLKYVDGTPANQSSTTQPGMQYFGGGKYFVVLKTRQSLTPAEVAELEKLVAPPVSKKRAATARSIGEVVSDTRAVDDGDEE